MKIEIRIQQCIWMIMAIVSVGGLIISGLNLTNSIYYLADALNVLIFLFAIREILYTKYIKQLTPLRVLLVLFIIVTVIGVIGNGVSLMLSLWGIRNIYRYIIFFISCIVLLDKEDIYNFINVLPKIFWIDFLVVLVQYFAFGIRGDYLGGILGIAQGCNGTTIIFVNIVIAVIMSQYLNKHRTLLQTVPYILAYFMIAALSETKGNYVFFVVITILAIMFSRKTLRTVSFGLVALLGIYIGLQLLDIYFPGSVDFLLDLDMANSYMNASYFGTTTFTRNSILSVANEYFFSGSTWLALFGFGIGACDMSNYFSSPFYDKYGYMNYRQYSSAMTLLQTGYLGFVIFVLFFVVISVISLRMVKKDSEDPMNDVFVAVSIVALFCIMDSFYATIYVDMGYWLFFVLAIPFICAKEDTYTQIFEEENNL